MGINMKYLLSTLMLASALSVFAADYVSTAQAGSCRTTCTTYGNTQTCRTTCY
jgi:hypothetical protein